MKKNNRRMTASRSLLITLGFMFTLAANAASINAMKVINKDYTRVIFSADSALTHEVLLLDNPKRLVLDIKNAPTNETIQMLGGQDWSKHLYIKKTRIGKLSETSSRVVFDLKSNVYHKISTETHPANAAKGTDHALILDIFKSR